MAVFLRLSGIAVLVWVAVQVGTFLSGATFSPGPFGLKGFFVFWLPSKAGVDDAFFFFNAIMGTLLWVFESGLGIVLILVGRCISASERKERLEYQQALERILRDREARETEGASAPRGEVG